MHKNDYKIHYQLLGCTYSHKNCNFSETTGYLLQKFSDYSTRRIFSTRCVIFNYFTRRSAIADCTACRAWNVKRVSFLLAVGAFWPKFCGNGVIPCQNI